MTFAIKGTKANELIKANVSMKIPDMMFNTNVMPYFVFGLNSFKIIMQTKPMA